MRLISESSLKDHSSEVAFVNVVACVGAVVEVDIDMVVDVNNLFVLTKHVNTQDI